MGKRIEVVPYRAPKRTFNNLVGTDPIKPSDVFAEMPEWGLKGVPGAPTRIVSPDQYAEEMLAHKRAIKAASMRRYRAKKAGK